MSAFRTLAKVARGSATRRNRRCRRSIRRQAFCRIGTRPRPVRPDGIARMAIISREEDPQSVREQLASLRSYPAALPTGAHRSDRGVTGPVLSRLPQRIASRLGRGTSRGSASCRTSAGESALPVCGQLVQAEAGGRRNEPTVDDQIVQGDVVAAEPPGPDTVMSRAAEEPKPVQAGSRPRRRPQWYPIPRPGPGRSPGPSPQKRWSRIRSTLPTNGFPRRGNHTSRRMSKTPNAPDNL